MDFSIPFLIRPSAPIITGIVVVFIHHNLSMSSMFCRSVGVISMPDVVCVYGR